MKKLLSSFSFLLTLLSVAPIFAADEINLTPVAPDNTYDLEAHLHRGYGSYSAENRVLEIRYDSVTSYNQVFIIDKDTLTETKVTDSDGNKVNASWGVYFDQLNSTATGPIYNTWSIVYAKEVAGGSQIFLKPIGSDTTGSMASSYAEIQLTDTTSEGYDLDPDMNFKDVDSGSEYKEIVFVRHDDLYAGDNDSIIFLKFKANDINIGSATMTESILTYRYSGKCVPQGIDAQGDALYPKWIDGSSVAFTFKFTDGGSAFLINHDRSQVATVYKQEAATYLAGVNDYYYSCGDNATTFSSFMFVTDTPFDHFRPMPTWKAIYSTAGSNDQYGLVYYIENAGVSQLAGSTLYQIMDPTSSYYHQTYTSNREQVLSDSTYNRRNPVFAPVLPSMLGRVELWIAYEREDIDSTKQIYGTKVELPEIKLVKAIPGLGTHIYPDWAVEVEPAPGTGSYTIPNTHITVTPPTGGFSFNNGGYAVKEDKFPFIIPTSVVDFGIVKGAKKAEKKWVLYVDGAVHFMTEYKSERISTLKEQMLAEFELDPSRFYQTKVEFKDKTVTFVTPIPLGESLTKRNTPNGLILILEEKKSGDSSKNWEFPVIRSAHAATYSSTLSSSVLTKFSLATDDEVRWTDCFDHRYPEFAELLNTLDGTTVATDAPNDLVYVKVIDTITNEVTHLFDLPAPVVEEECGEPTEPTEPDPKEPDPKEPAEEDCESLGWTVYNSTMSGEMSDADGDGYADGDTDHDGMPDKCDACPDIAPYWDGKPFTDDDGNETCVEQSDCGCSSCCGCSGDITVTATAEVGDITVTGGDTNINISYTGDSGDIEPVVDPDVDPVITTELGIAAAEGTPEGDAIFTGSSCGCSFNTPTSVVQIIQQMFWLMFFGIPIFLKRRSLSKSK